MSNIEKKNGCNIPIPILSVSLRMDSILCEERWRSEEKKETNGKYGGKNVMKLKSHKKA